MYHPCGASELDDECEGVVEGGALEGAEMEVEEEEWEWRGGGGVLRRGRMRSREEALGVGGATWRGGGGAIG